MKGKTILRTALFAMIAVIAISGSALAQSKSYSKRQVSSIIANLERSSNSFRRDFDRYLDDSSLNGTSEEDRINDIVRRYEEALDRLRRDFDSRDNWWQSRDNVSRVMDEAYSVNSMMDNLSFARKLERQWRSMRSDINKLADTYDLPPLGSTSGGGNAPSWAVGVFEGRNPQTGGTIRLQIVPNGNVVITMDGGSVSDAKLRDERLYNGPYVSRVTRINNGIRTTDVTNGSYIDYFRIGNDLSGGNAPSWAVGTFYGRNPQTGGSITLTVASDGRVTVATDGNLSYATMRDERLYNGPYVSRVTRIRNGIRTTSVTNGEYIDYFRTNDNLGGVTDGNAPKWAVGTFYGRNPQNGGTITLNIASDGRVVITMDGTTTYATMRDERLYNGPYVSRVTKINNGIRTTDVSNGSYVDYFRTNDNFGGGGGNAPGWAVGTFYGRNPQTGGTITLNISSDGRVVITMDNGTVTNATMRDERLYNGPYVSRVTKIRNGIRTTDTTNGSYIDYYRNR